MLHSNPVQAPPPPQILLHADLQQIESKEYTALRQPSRVTIGRNPAFLLVEARNTVTTQGSSSTV